MTRDSRMSSSAVNGVDPVMRRCMDIRETDNVFAMAVCETRCSAARPRTFCATSALVSIAMR